MKRFFVLERNDGHIAILTVMPGSDFDKIIKDFGKVSFVPISVTEIPESKVPPYTPEGRKNRDAWRFVDGKIIGV